jgi:hypothetical protein
VGLSIKPCTSQINKITLFDKGLIELDEIKLPILNTKPSAKVSFLPVIISIHT